MTYVNMFMDRFVFKVDSCTVTTIFCCFFSTKLSDFHSSNTFASSFHLSVIKNESANGVNGDHFRVAFFC